MVCCLSSRFADRERCRHRDGQWPNRYGCLGRGHWFFAADGDVAFAEQRAGIALAVAAFMLRQGGAVVEAFIHVLAGGLGRTTKGALIEAVAAFQAAAVADADTHAAGAVAAFVADVFKAETAGGEFVVVFVCGRSDGAPLSRTLSAVM